MNKCEFFFQWHSGKYICMAMVREWPWGGPPSGFSLASRLHFSQNKKKVYSSSWCRDSSPLWRRLEADRCLAACSRLQNCCRSISNCNNPYCCSPELTRARPGPHRGRPSTEISKAEQPILKAPGLGGPRRGTGKTAPGWRPRGVTGREGSAALEAREARGGRGTRAGGAARAQWPRGRHAALRSPLKWAGAPGARHFKGARHGSGRRQLSSARREAAAVGEQARRAEALRPLQGGGGVRRWGPSGGFAPGRDRRAAASGALGAPTLRTMALEQLCAVLKGKRGRGRRPLRARPRSAPPPPSRPLSGPGRPPAAAAS